MVWRAVAIKLQHMCMCLAHSWGDEGMTLLNSCQVLKSLAFIDFWWQFNSWSIEQVSSPAGLSWRSRYMLSHIWSKMQCTQWGALWRNSQQTTLQYQMSSERNGSSTCPASPSAMENNLFYRRAPSLLWVPPKCPSLSTLQLLKESVMSSGRTLQEGIVQKSTRKPKKFYNTSRTRRGWLTTPPERNWRPSKPSGKTPPVWF